MSTTESPGPMADIESVEPEKTPPVRYMAFFGAVCLAFIVFVLARWVTGPYWKEVPTGPTPVPQWMQNVLDAWVVGGIIAAIFTLYWVVVRPYRRDKRLSTDGVFVLACSVLWFQDPLSQYLGYWFTYNTYFWNRGSWVNSVPGWMAGGEPGATLVEPLQWVIPFYIYGWLPWVILGCWFMNKLRKRWPAMKVHWLVIWGWLFMGAIDVFVEGTLFIPLGFFQYGGSHVAIWPEAYHKFPVINIFLIGMISTGLACLRYFKNDKGETLVERGVENLKISGRRKDGLRVLAMIGGTQAVLLVFNIITGVVYGGHTAEWPEDTQRRSYFTSGICGEGTDRACPGPGIPKFRGPDTIHIDSDGNLIVPEGAEENVPETVPLDTEPRGPFNGPFIDW